MQFHATCVHDDACSHVIPREPHAMFLTTAQATVNSLVSAPALSNDVKMATVTFSAGSGYARVAGVTGNYVVVGAFALASALDAYEGLLTLLFADGDSMAVVGTPDQLRSAIELSVGSAHGLHRPMRLGVGEARGVPTLDVKVHLLVRATEAPRRRVVQPLTVNGAPGAHEVEYALFDHETNGDEDVELVLPEQVRGEDLVTVSGPPRDCANASISVTPAAPGSEPDPRQTTRLAVERVLQSEESGCRSSVCTGDAKSLVAKVHTRFNDRRDCTVYTFHFADGTDGTDGTKKAGPVRVNPDVFTCWKDGLVSAAYTVDHKDRTAQDREDRKEPAVSAVQVAKIPDPIAPAEASSGGPAAAPTSFGASEQDGFDAAKDFAAHVAEAERLGYLVVWNELKSMPPDAPRVVCYLPDARAADAIQRADGNPELRAALRGVNRVCKGLWGIVFRA